MNSLGRKLAAPLLFANLIMYFIVLGFASWCVNRYINGQSHHPSLGGNPATEFFLTFALLTAVLGIVSKFAGGTHLRFWRNDSLAAAGSLSMVAWAVTALAFGFACKEINIGGYRGWRLRVLEGFIIVLAFTELFYLVFIHMGMFDNRYGPGYRDTSYGVGAPAGEPEHNGGGVTATRVV